MDLEVTGSSPVSHPFKRLSAAVVDERFLLSSLDVASIRSLRLGLDSSSVDLSGDDHDLHVLSTVGASVGASGDDR